RVNGNMIEGTAGDNCVIEGIRFSEGSRFVLDKVTNILTAPAESVLDLGRSTFNGIIDFQGEGGQIVIPTNYVQGGAETQPPTQHMSIQGKIQSTANGELRLLPDNGPVRIGGTTITVQEPTTLRLRTNEYYNALPLDNPDNSITLYGGNFIVARSRATLENTALRLADQYERYVLPNDESILVLDVPLGTTSRDRSADNVRLIQDKVNARITMINALREPSSSLQTIHVDGRYGEQTIAAVTAIQQDAIDHGRLRGVERERADGLYGVNTDTKTTFIQPINSVNAQRAVIHTVTVQERTRILQGPVPEQEGQPEQGYRITEGDRDTAVTSRSTTQFDREGIGMVTTVRSSPGDSPLPTGEFNDEIIAHTEIDPDTGEITINHRNSGPLTVRYDGTSRDPIIRRNGAVVAELLPNERILVAETDGCNAGTCFRRASLDEAKMFGIPFRYGQPNVPSLLNNIGNLGEEIDRAQVQSGDQVAIVPPSRQATYRNFLHNHPDPSTYDDEEIETYNSFFTHIGTAFSPEIMRHQYELGGEFGNLYNNIDDLNNALHGPGPNDDADLNGRIARYIRPNANLLASND
ncbi:hypothetical protein J4464_03305, partial [Candidatus Woesearchaeota archaeon]|nr:hypothetical protein [Candidatus Woesearchaeota archaeon]